jgi:hypothetical protein
MKTKTGKQQKMETKTGKQKNSNNSNHESILSKWGFINWSHKHNTI